MGRMFNHEPTPETKETKSDNRVNVCLFCSEPNDEKVKDDFMMELPMDEQSRREYNVAPETRFFMNDDKPCAKCREYMGDSFILVDVSEKPLFGERQKPTLRGLCGTAPAYLTGEYMLLENVESARAFFPDRNIQDDQTMLLVPQGFSKEFEANLNARIAELEASRAIKK